MKISVQLHDFEPAVEQQALELFPGAGAVVTFTGLVRNQNEGQSITSLTLEHYPGMTEKSLEKIVIEAKQRWTLEAVRVIHRVGTMAVGERIVFVGVAAAHRGEAFAACEFIMDYLKTKAPFWKKEQGECEGRWVDARETDDQAVSRWQKD